MTSADLPSASWRATLLRAGIALERLTVGYNALEGLIAIVAGLAAGPSYERRARSTAERSGRTRTRRSSAPGCP